MSTNARNARLSEREIATIVTAVVAALQADAPAKTTRKAAAKPKARKAAAPKPATKGSRAVGHGSGLSRKGWNQTLSAKARLAGGDTYRRVTADWAEVQTLRNAGATPDEVLALYTR